MNIFKYRLLETAQTDGGSGGGGESQQTNQESNSAEIEQKARQMGWQPKEMWKGNPDNWVDAGEFVKRGETFVPFLQAERRRMTGELDTLRQQNTHMQTQLAETQNQLREITEFNRQMAVDRDNRRKSELGSAIRAEEDPVRRAEMETELRQITDRESQRNQNQNQNRQQPPQNQNQQQSPVQIQPWVKNYLDQNVDFFNDPDRAVLFNSKMLQRRQAGDSRVGEVKGVELFNEVMEEVNQRLGGNQRRQAPSRTEDSRPSSGGGGGNRSGQKTFHDLPSEAQAKCDQQESKFVGQGKLFKTKDEWRRHYVTEYFR